MTGVDILDGTDSEGRAVLLLSLVNRSGDQSMVLLDKEKIERLRERLDRFLQSDAES